MKKLLLLSTITLMSLACNDKSANVETEKDINALEVVDDIGEDSVVYEDLSKFEADARPDENFLKITDKEVRKQVLDDIRQIWEDGGTKPDVARIEIKEITRYESYVMCKVILTMGNERKYVYIARRRKSSPANRFEFSQ